MKYLFSRSSFYILSWGSSRISKQDTAITTVFIYKKINNIKIQAQSQNYTSLLLLLPVITLRTECICSSLHVPQGWRGSFSTWDSNYPWEDLNTMDHCWTNLKTRNLTRSIHSAPSTWLERIWHRSMPRNSSEGKGKATKLPLSVKTYMIWEGA